MAGTFRDLRSKVGTGIGKAFLKFGQVTNDLITGKTMARQKARQKAKKPKVVGDLNAQAKRGV